MVVRELNTAVQFSCHALCAIFQYCSPSAPLTALQHSEVFGGTRNGRRLRLDYFLPTRVAFPADMWEDVMGYRCRDACGLAAAAVAKVSGGSFAPDSGDEDADSTGDVEMGEFYSGALLL